MDPFLAEIRPFAFSFAPKGWAQCNGQLMAISQNTALFSLLGTIYGGDGRSTFALPNLQGCVPVHQGQGPGLQQWSLGELQGSPTVTLLAANLALHSHTLTATSTTGTLQQAGPTAQLAKAYKGSLSSANTTQMYSSGAPNVQLAPTSLALTGVNQPHNNMMPYLTVMYCIALQGQFPARN